MKNTLRLPAITLTGFAIGAFVVAWKGPKNGSEKSAPKGTRKGNRAGESYPLNTPTTGWATLVEAPGVCDLRLTDLEMQFCPALQAWLYEAAVPAVGSDANILAAGQHLVVGELKMFSGDFIFAVPKRVRADKYHSVILWCSEANKYFAAAPLV